jgi:hypothetical protein
MTTKSMIIVFCIKYFFFKKEKQTMTNSWDLISKSILLITKGQVIFFGFNLKKKIINKKR